MIEDVPLTPAEIVSELDRWIIGQQDAKRAVAIALRDRWRRRHVEPEQMRDEIAPKNILMIGPTGVGKTEIARRLAVLVKAPFIKVEATKFTEVGYVGRDVDSIIRDLIDEAVAMIRSAEITKVEMRAEEIAYDRLVNLLKTQDEFKDRSEADVLHDLREGDLDELMVEIEVSVPSLGVEILSPPGMEEMTNQLQNLMENLSADKSKLKKMSVTDALRHVMDEESGKMINKDEIIAEALEAVEQQGIVFIDEIDKVIKGDQVGGEVSREGVQRDLLPMIEGSTIFTKYGAVKTDHILFIAAGAFMGVSPSDMASELQGRLPIRVELSALSAADFVRILIEPDNALTRQYQSLMAVEIIKLKFTKGGIQRIADIAYSVNESTTNIGARRLYTIMEKLLESVSFHSPDYENQTVNVDLRYVNAQLADLLKSENLSRWIL
jgi:ATP-dependent HslUV protease ATP-binding subunit HslU